VELLPDHFRVWSTPDSPTVPDLELVVDEQPDRRPPVETVDDPLVLRREDGLCRVTTTISTLVVDARANPITARLTLWPAAQRPEYVDHYVVVNLRALLRILGRVQLHGAASRLGSRTMVFLGDKGAGKSTLTLALGRAGATALADDQLMLRVDGPRVWISGVDGGLRVTAQTEEHFFRAPLTVDAQDFGGLRKKEVPLREHVHAAPGIEHVPDAIFFPRVGEAFELAPIERGVATRRILTAVAPLHRFAGPTDQQAFVRMITALVRAVEVFDLRLSPDLDELERVVATLAGHAP
jgi:hypothetical protein